MSVIIFENPNLTIFYYEDKDYLLLKWSGFVSSDSFRFLANTILSAIDKTKTKRILSDNSDWKVIPPNDHGWAANNWFPKAEEKGITMLATVVSSDYFNRAAEQSIENMAEVTEMQIKNFGSFDEALSWLTNSKSLSKAVQFN